MAAASAQNLQLLALFYALVTLYGSLWCHTVYNLPVELGVSIYCGQAPQILIKSLFLAKIPYGGCINSKITPPSPLLRPRDPLRLPLVPHHFQSPSGIGCLNLLWTGTPNTY